MVTGFLHNYLESTQQTDYMKSAINISGLYSGQGVVQTCWNM